MNEPRLYRPNSNILVPAKRWTGVLADMPDKWLEKDWVFVNGDGTATVRTRNGLSDLDHIGDYVVAEYDDDLLYPVRRHIFQAKYLPTGGDDE